MSELLARIEHATTAPGSAATVELWLSPVARRPETVFAAMVVVHDEQDRFAVVFSPRRDEWGVPGGWREEGESVADCAVREVFEETGLRVSPADLRAVGFETFDPPPSRAGRSGGRCLQVFRARAGGGSDLVSSAPDAVDPNWVTGRRLKQLCGGQFWWPLVDAVVRTP